MEKEKAFLTGSRVAINIVILTLLMAVGGSALAQMAMYFISIVIPHVEYNTPWLLLFHAAWWVFILTLRKDAVKIAARRYCNSS